ncbi:MAG: hypothetical protein V2J12_01550 [Gammaproteobacteria bacterium]|nr:hypothetical protein [Gammaproteobacteria bacterium]
MRRRLWALQVRLTVILVLLLVVAQGALGLGTRYLNAWAVVQRLLGQAHAEPLSWLAKQAGPWVEALVVIVLAAAGARGLVRMLQLWKLM